MAARQRQRECQQQQQEMSSVRRGIEDRQMDR